MRMFRILAVSLVLGLCLSNAWAETLTGIVAFGDSLSDVGNVYAATGDIYPASPPYFDGRFSNGPIWLERLASRLGLPQPVGSYHGGTIFACGGAETGSGTSSMNAPNMGKQVSDYLAVYPPSASELYVFWGGANDVFAGLVAGETPDPLVSVANLAQLIRTMVTEGGAEHLLVPNMPPLGRTPWGLTLTSQQQQQLDLLSAGFNSALSTQLAQLRSNLDVRIDELDIYGTFMEAVNNPAGYGLSNVTEPALSAPAGADPDEYLFWDEVHPTAAAHALIGNMAADLVLVPEPGSLALLAAGSVGLIALAWRRRTVSFHVPGETWNLGSERQ